MEPAARPATRDARAVGAAEQPDAVARRRRVGAAPGARRVVIAPPKRSMGGGGGYGIIRIRRDGSLGRQHADETACGGDSTLRRRHAEEMAR
eukprot:gene6943-biopygen7100